MAGTKDFIIDLTSKLEKQSIEYLLVTISKNKKERNVDIFFDLKNDNSAISMVEVLDEIQGNLIEQIEENQEKQENDPNSKKLDELMEDLE